MSTIYRRIAHTHSDPVVDGPEFGCHDFYSVLTLWCLGHFTNAEALAKMESLANAMFPDPATPWWSMPSDEQQEMLDLKAHFDGLPNTTAEYKWLFLIWPVVVLLERDEVTYTEAKGILGIT